MGIQLEFNFYGESAENRRFAQMEEQIREIKESTDKVRRKLFSDMSELKKALFYLKCENHELKQKINNILGEKAEWNYLCNENLFELVEKQKAAI
jgi:hypothetical protein